MALFLVSTSIFFLTRGSCTARAKDTFKRDWPELIEDRRALLLRGRCGQRAGVEFSTLHSTNVLQFTTLDARFRRRQSVSRLAPSTFEQLGTELIEWNNQEPGASPASVGADAGVATP
jgi:hypothetical protein